MNRLWVFDLDDTLITNVHDYADPILDACRLIIETLGTRAPHVSKIVTMEQEIDKRRVKEIDPVTGKPYRFSMERFPGSLVETYREICRQARTPVSQKVESALYEIGLRAFDEKRYAQNIYPNALKTCAFLVGQGDILALLTKGDERVQSNKIKALERAGVLQHFTVVKVVDDKSSEQFRCISKSLEHVPSRMLSVGNSYESDIIPALETGFHGVWIPVETWDVIGKMDELKAKVDRARCTILNDLSDIPKFYREL